MSPFELAHHYFVIARNVQVLDMLTLFRSSLARPSKLPPSYASIAATALLIALSGFWVLGLHRISAALGNHRISAADVG